MAEQSRPRTGSDSQPAWPHARERISDAFSSQHRKGSGEYGQGLHTHDGRHSWWDLWEELADVVNYAGKCELETLALVRRLLDAERRCTIAAGIDERSAPRVSCFICSVVSTPDLRVHAAGCPFDRSGIWWDRDAS